jgi:branched-chain amino acid transport system substrate-binding protein
MLEEAVRRAKTTENEAVMRVLKDLPIKAPVGLGPDGTVTMRGRDQTVINYAVGWGVTIPEEPYLVNIVSGSWNEMIEEETAWLRNKGWL